jgi:hypothetical protein
MQIIEYLQPLNWVENNVDFLYLPAYLREVFLFFQKGDDVQLKQPMDKITGRRKLLD